MSDTAPAETKIDLTCPRSDRVIIIAPVGDDAGAIADLLTDEHFATEVCRDVAQRAGFITEGAGTLLLTEEALESPQLPNLFEALATQPAWSELPLIILTSGGESRRARLLDLTAAAAGVVTLLERPISTRTLVRSVQVALRSRRRQYEVRDLLAQLHSLNQTLEQRVMERTAEAVDRAAKLRRLTAELSLAEDRERRRISEVLHEDVQQLLVSARLSLAVLGQANGASKRDALTRDISEVLERSFELIRSLTAELAPAVLYECGLAAALEWLATRTRKQHGIRVTVRADSSADPEGADVRVLLFRAVRELLLNSAKHAGGSAVEIAMGNDGPGKVRIIVCDEGAGFDAAKLDGQGVGSGGLGLFSIRERVSSIGGDFRIESAPGRGTKVTLLAPRDSPSDGIRGVA
jgi:signal transduction histidine kinase